MDLDMLEFQLKEEKVNSKVHDLHRRVKELRALNNSSKDICKKIGIEFKKDYDQVKKLLLPTDLKEFVGKNTEELEKVGEKRMKDLKRKYSKHVNDRAKTKSSMLNSIIDSYIKNGR